MPVPDNIRSQPIADGDVCQNALIGARLDNKISPVMAPAAALIEKLGHCVNTP